MSAGQIAKRDKIGKAMINEPTVVAKFKDDYGDDWESYIWATATNVAMGGGE
jgi:hypothetical protein